MSKEEKKAPAIPEGFEIISDGSLPETHDWNKSDTVMGRVINMKVVPVKRGNKFEDNKLMTVDTGSGNTAVWESAGLKDLFDVVVPGDTVFMKYLGTVDLENGLNPMKQFQTGYQATGNRNAAQG